MKPRTALRAMKAFHTFVWMFFVLAIVAIWVFAAQGNIVSAGLAIAVVLIEVAILGLNHGQCPLGGIARRYTENRTANFDIYLPAWLAGRTKSIFGPLFGAAVLFTAIRWATTAP